jgi:glycosyltransferase involved in cell wall biosynthesis
MRIGVFCDCGACWGGVGGLVTHGLELMNILVKKGHEVHLFTESVVEGKETFKRVKIHKIPTKFGYYDHSYTSTFNKKLKNLDLDLVNLQLPFFPLDYYIPKIKFPCPVVGTLHQSFSGRSIYDFILKTYYKIFTKRTLSSCDRIICVSKAVKQSIKTKKPVDVIYNGIDTKTFKPGKRKGEFLLFVGRVLFEKGIHHLVRMHNILRKEKDIEVRVIGKGPLSPFMRFTNINYLSKVPKHILVENYQKAQLGIFPSLWHEAGSRVLLECMACGTPGVAYNTGAFPEIIDTEIDGFMCSKNPSQEIQSRSYVQPDY